jgi:hypothetical protein
MLELCLEYAQVVLTLAGEQKGKTDGSGVGGGEQTGWFCEALISQYIVLIHLPCLTPATLLNA